MDACTARHVILCSDKSNQVEKNRLAHQWSNNHWMEGRVYTQLNITFEWAAVIASAMLAYISPLTPARAV